ncbi:hypothetical protein JCM8547_008696 [Rhodosporidiobolus lusitaniae]
MASPPYKMSKLHHSPALVPSSLASPTSKLHLSSSSSSSRSAPAPAPTKRLGLQSASSSSKIKKLTLKPSSSSRASPSATSNTPTSSSLIPTLVASVRAIHARPPQPTPESLQALYTLCEAVVASGAATSQLLYDRIRMEIERAAGGCRAALREGGEKTDEGEERWLGEVEKEGRGYLEKMLLVRSVFLTLERTYVLQTPGLESIWDLGLDVFRHSVLSDDGISTRITSSLLHLIQRERTGTLIPRPLLRSLLSLLHTFSPSTYTTLFTSPFYASTSSFYESEGQTLAATLDSSAYLRRVTERLKEEGERCESVVGEEHREKVLGMVEEKMISGHVEAIAEKDTAELCKNNAREDLSTLYVLLSRISKVDVLRRAFLEHLKSSGHSLVLDTSQDAQMVPNLISFRHTALALVQDCFANAPEFAAAINGAFEFFINKRENKPAEMMAKYLDAKLRSGNRSMDDAQLEATLNDVLYLFRFTQGKDIFEAFYKRDLAKRLLLNKSASFDAERSMLLKLKDECGAGFTQKLELMFKDMELSQDVMQAYHGTSLASSSYGKKNDAKGGGDVDLSVSILSQGNWPTYPPFPICLPPSLTSHLERFKAFYVSKHSGRTLTWAHGLDTCSLRAVFPKGGRKELLVSLGQAVVLMLFNEVEGDGKLSVEEIGEATKLETKELKRTLQSLACGKVRVLVKHPKGRDVNPGDQFSFNQDFKDDHIRIKINQIQQKETVEENKSTTERVFTDRSSHLQLAIVRIMKARKTLKHQELVMEVISQIGQRFKVEPAEIKKSISSLIDREYMRRAEDQQNVYEYVA